VDAEHDPVCQKVRSTMTGQTLWLDDPAFAALKFPVAEGQLQTDVAIIGAGITGLSTACHLKARLPDVDVVVLERERVASGASGRSSGALTHIPGLRWADEVARYGEAETRRAAAFQGSGVETALKLIEEGEIHCDLRSPGYMMLGRERDVPRLHQELEAMRRLGSEGRFLASEDLKAVLKQDYYRAAVWAPARWLNPGRYALGPARLAQKRGARIFEQSAVSEVRRGRPMRLSLARGGDVQASTVVLATNGYTPKLGYLGLRIFPLHTCAVATEPLSGKELDSVGWSDREVLFEAAQTGHTLYLTPDDRLVCRGTIRYQFNNGVAPFDLSDVEAVLAAAIDERFPQLRPVRISHSWSGLLGMTRSFQPAIGRLRGRGDILYGVGYSGHGIALASLAGRLLAELFAGDQSEEQTYALEHAVPPLMPPEPLRYLAINALTGWQRRRGH
jgi:glycine/D-amino acid oxidase-like deaminating enzyme